MSVDKREAYFAEMGYTVDELVDAGLSVLCQKTGKSREEEYEDTARYIKSLKIDPSKSFEDLLPKYGIDYTNFFPNEEFDVTGYLCILGFLAVNGL